MGSDSGQNNADQSDWPACSYSPTTLLAHIAKERELRAAVEKRLTESEEARGELEADYRRWQDSIRRTVIRESGVPEWKIDGGGCESGDPLDLTLAEIRLGFAFVLDATKAKISVLESHNRALAGGLQNRGVCDESDAVKLAAVQKLYDDARRRVAELEEQLDTRQGLHDLLGRLATALDLVRKYEGSKGTE